MSGAEERNARAPRRRGNTVRRQVWRYGTDGHGQASAVGRRDTLATEEPLEIRVSVAGGEATPVSVTMRTPGSDFELAAGFLFGEGLIQAGPWIRHVRYCVDPGAEQQHYNAVLVDLERGVPFEPERLRRNFYTTSSCGVCGKASIEAVLGPACTRVVERLRIGPDRLLSLPDRFRAAQQIFERTGGLHAAALFTPEGALLDIREDVGRHNAMDKLIGAAVLRGAVPLGNQILMVSGRLSFELVQKAARAGVEVLAGVSAPSSLAVELADETGITLVGFLREHGFNVYTAPERLSGGDAAAIISTGVEDG